MAEAKSGQIVNVMKEERLFPPPAEFAAKARISSLEQYEKLWNEAAADLEGFWGKHGRRTALVQALQQGARLERAVRPVVRRRADQRLATTAWTSIWTRRGGTRPPSSGKASRATSACSPTRCCTREVCKFANVLKALGIGRATWWRSTCRWCPSWPSPCWPARGSARSTRWSSAGFRPRPSPTATTTPRPS